MTVQLPQNSFEEVQFQMINAHDTFKCGYDSIIKHLESPPKDDLPNFAGYCKAWAEAIDIHHKSEEAIVFPFLNTKMDFSGEAEAHKVIEDGIHGIIAYIDEFSQDITKFDAERLKGLMVNLKDPLYSHLDEEVEHIAPDNLRQAGFTENELRSMLDSLVAYARSHGNVFLVLPFMRAHTVPEVKPVWPQLPWLVRQVLVPYVFAMRYSGYWKYAPYPLS
ncbi:hypothetical protein M422DRAFT_26564 [Sphaerobolus stellatus SS14]|nr:hypothetical protein M422DRAFT_26564 [Sphaerobolus stellatus SS14]